MYFLTAGWGRWQLALPVALLPTTHSFPNSSIFVVRGNTEQRFAHRQGLQGGGGGLQRGGGGDKTGESFCHDDIYYQHDYDSEKVGAIIRLHIVRSWRFSLGSIWGSTRTHLFLGWFRLVSDGLISVDIGWVWLGCCV